MIGLKSGQKFVTDRDEITVRYEVGISLEGQGKLEGALAEFDWIKKQAPSDSYYAMGASYEVSRLHLALWLANPMLENVHHLESAVTQLRVWLARDWNKLTTKLWGHYHGVCAYRQKLNLHGNKGQGLDRVDQERLDQYTSSFQSIARTQKGVRKYDLRFTAFFLTSKSYERFPGEPLRCNLDDLLAEFRIF